MDGVILPQAAWRVRPGFARLIEVLGPGTARVVGGAVRDTLLGLDTSDVDLATIHQPQHVIDLLEAARIKAVPTGLQHGTITAVEQDEVYEITTLRRDVATDGRHATVAFTDDWREDAARRDFTINALYADPQTGEVFDYFGGLDDLDRGRVRFIGDPLQRIAEDHLRILRFFRFLARFGDVADDAGLAACTARANDLMALSRERIAAELLKLLVALHAVRVMSLMIAQGILRPVIPEIVADGVNRLALLDARETASGIAPQPIRRLAALLPPMASVTDDVGARLKLSNADRKRLNSAVAAIGEDPPQTLAYRLGRDQAIDRLLLSARPIDDVTAIATWDAPALPLSGGALVERGVGKGPDVARLLREIETAWVTEGFPDAARVSVLADDAVDHWLRSIRNS